MQHLRGREIGCGVWRVAEIRGRRRYKLHAQAEEGYVSVGDYKRGGKIVK